ncbi:MAG: hypothetical protein ABSF08_10850 [Candidatus Cybelea sp.]
MTDPDFFLPACGFAAIAYGVCAAALFLIIPSARANTMLRNDARIVAPIFTIVAIALALVAIESPRASQALLPILMPAIVFVLPAAGIALIALAVRTLKNRATRIAALVGAAIPLAVTGGLLLIGYQLSHARFCC